MSLARPLARPLARSGLPARRRASLSAAALLLSGSFVLWGLGACGESQPPRAAPAAEGLPSYGPSAASLLDDSFAPEIFGVSTGSDEAKDDKLPLRSEAAEAVVIARISTITQDADGTSLAYRLVLTPVGKPLLGNWNGAIDIDVAENNPSFPLVDSVGVRLTGRQVILFLRRYNQNGRATLHFRAEADTPAMQKAIERTRGLNAFGP